VGTARTPIPLRTGLDLDQLCLENPCEETYLLGSFWPYSRVSFESHVVKGFKECVPTRDFEPHISALCEFYARAALTAIRPKTVILNNPVILNGVKDLSAGAEILRPAQNDVCRPTGARFDWVVRVLGSAETRPDQDRPLTLLSAVLCRATGARDATHLFYKSQSRPPMRMVERLSGSEALRNRLRYVVQDLFMRPAELGGTALLIDDIANTGASARAYAAALKAHAGIERVIAVGLAATRFRSGSEIRGILKLDTSPLDAHPTLRRVVLDSQPAVHLIENCPSIQPPFTLEMRFLAERRGAACAECCEEKKGKRKWWQVR
jgi:hypothetical protein